MRYLALLATLALGNLVIIVMLVALATCHLADAVDPRRAHQDEPIR